jgi:hypothetical protein
MSSLPISLSSPRRRFASLAHAVIDGLHVRRASASSTSSTSAEATPVDAFTTPPPSPRAPPSSPVLVAAAPPSLAGVTSLVDAAPRSGAALGAALCLHAQPVSLATLKDRATLGSEFTFLGDNFDNSNHALRANVVGNPATRKARDDLAALVRARFPACTVTDSTNRYGAMTYAVESPSGFTVTIATDPDVVETQITPMTHAGYARVAGELQALLFDSARQVGMVPDDGEAGRAAMKFSLHAGGGHIHVGLNSTFRDARHLLNFIIDQQNHPELAIGGMTHEPYNAPPLAIQTAAQRAAFRALIDDVTPKLDAMTCEDLADRITNEVFQTKFAYTPPKKYQQLGLQYAGNGTPVERRTVELRANRPQGSVDDFLAITELILERVALCSRVGDVLPYVAEQVPEDADPTAPETTRFRHDVPLERAQQNLDGMYRYFREMGRDFDASLRFIEPPLRERFAQGLLRDPRRHDTSDVPSTLERVQRATRSRPATPVAPTSPAEHMTT